MADLWFASNLAKGVIGSVNILWGSCLLSMQDPSVKKRRLQILATIVSTLNATFFLWLAFAHRMPWRAYVVLLFSIIAILQWLFIEVIHLACLAVFTIELRRKHKTISVTEERLNLILHLGQIALVSTSGVAATLTLILNLAVFNTFSMLFMGIFVIFPMGTFLFFLFRKLREVVEKNISRMESSFADGKGSSARKDGNDSRQSGVVLSKNSGFINNQKESGPPSIAPPDAGRASLTTSEIKSVRTTPSPPPMVEKKASVHVTVCSGKKKKRRRGGSLRDTAEHLKILSRLIVFGVFFMTILLIFAGFSRLLMYPLDISFREDLDGRFYSGQYKPVEDGPLWVLIFANIAIFLYANNFGFWRMIFCCEC